MRVEKVKIEIVEKDSTGLFTPATINLYGITFCDLETALDCMKELNAVIVKKQAESAKKV